MGNVTEARRLYQGAFRRRNAKCMRREGIRIRCKAGAHLCANNKKHGGDAAEKSGDVIPRQSRSSIRTCLHVKAILSVRNKEESGKVRSGG